MTRLNHNRTDEGGGQFQAETEVGLLLRGLQNPTDSGQLDSSKKIMEWVIAVTAVAQQHFFAPLSDHTKRRLEYAVNWLHRRGKAGQMKTLERLHHSIFADRPRNPLHQFLAVGLYPLCLTL